MHASLRSYSDFTNSNSNTVTCASRSLDGVYFNGSADAVGSAIDLNPMPIGTDRNFTLDHPDDVTSAEQALTVVVYAKPTGYRKFWRLFAAGSATPSSC